MTRRRKITDESLEAPMNKKVGKEADPTKYPFRVLTFR
jgi:hypothetical protein